ncbi:MAG: phosphate signaling complex protein PhoU [Chloroflexota bacterium]
MTREIFDRSLKALQDKVLGLGSAVEENLVRAAKALIDADRQLAQQLIDFDSWVNTQRIEIVLECLTLIATQQPTGSDMRSLAANIEIAGELERIHDYVKGIGKIVLITAVQEIPKPVNELLPTMAEIASEMLHAAMNAFMAGDVTAARAIPLRDDEVDDLYKTASHALAVSVTSDISTYEHSNGLQWAFHNLERSADRVINICEWIVYKGTGQYVEFDSEYESPVTASD